MRDAVTSDWASTPSLTLQRRPDASFTSYPGLVPVVLKATNSYLPFGVGTRSAPPGPFSRSRSSRSVGSCHSSAISAEALGWAWGEYAHATSATRTTTVLKGVRKLIIRSFRYVVQKIRPGSAAKPWRRRD